MDSEEQYLINGALMKKYSSQQVRIWINIAGNTSTGGSKVQGTTTDDRIINVALAQPLNQPISGWIEVIGKPVDATTINCSEILVFEDDENNEPLDQNSHNHIIKVLENMQNFYKTGEEMDF